MALRDFCGTLVARLEHSIERSKRDQNYMQRIDKQTLGTTMTPILATNEKPLPQNDDSCAITSPHSPATLCCATDRPCACARCSPTTMTLCVRCSNRYQRNRAGCAFCR